MRLCAAWSLEVGWSVGCVRLVRGVLRDPSVHPNTLRLTVVPGPSPTPVGTGTSSAVSVTQGPLGQSWTWARHNRPCRTVPMVDESGPARSQVFGHGHAIRRAGARDSVQVRVLHSWHTCGCDKRPRCAIPLLGKRGATAVTATGADGHARGRGRARHPEKIRTCRELVALRLPPPNRYRVIRAASTGDRAHSGHRTIPAFPTGLLTAHSGFGAADIGWPGDPRFVLRRPTVGVLCRHVVRDSRTRWPLRRSAPL